MTDEFDWHAAIDELQERWATTPPSSYPSLDLDRNQVAVSMPTELLDRLQVTREINRRMTEAFLEATEAATDTLLGDVDNWRPVGLLTRGALPAPIRVLGPPPGFVESPVWTALWEEAARQWSKAEIEFDSDDRNARAVEWWRSQRPRPRMTLAEAMDKIRTEYGARSISSAGVDKPVDHWSSN